MSVQTGRASLPPPPGSTRAVRLAHAMTRARDEPNPVWMRELRQAARLTRTPVILAVVTAFVTLLVASIGGIAATFTEPAKVGAALFHVFFTVAFAVVAWVGPAVAASTIAAERGGRTWEALLLTGLGAPSIARGKFLAAFTYIALYLVMLAPVGGLTFLFGGVTATEVFLAFAFLALFAVLAVAFGLAVSARMASAATAIVVSLIVSVPLSLFVYFVLGVWLSFGIHELWPSVPAGPPVWLPGAYVRASFGVEYVTLLVAAPLALTLIPAWFLYETTVAAMGSLSDDRSTGIRRWFVVSAPLLAVACFLPSLALTSDQDVGAALGLAAYFCFLVGCVLLFAGEPLGPSRRVRLHWQRRGAGRLTETLGPGLMPATSWLVGIGLGGLGLVTAAGAALCLLATPPTAGAALRVVVLGAYAAAFFLFLAGLMAWLRARAQSAAGPRLLVLAALFLAFAGPWIVMAITGVITDARGEARLLAAPSPLFALEMGEQLHGTDEHRELLLMAGSACLVGWALLGAGLLAGASARARRVIAAHESRQRELDRVLEEEDARAAAERDAPAPG